MIHKSLYLMLALLISTLYLKGQSTPDETDLFAKLVRAEAKFASFEDFSAIIEVGNKPSKGKGSGQLGLFFYRDGIYHMDFEEDEIIADGRNMMTWYKAFAEVAVVPDQPLTDLTLRGMYRLYEPDNPHSAKWGGETDEFEIIECYDKNPEGLFFKKVVYISKKSGLIEKWELFSGGMGNFSYWIYDIQTNQALDDRLFQIPVEFVDMVQSGKVEPIDVHGAPSGDPDEEGHEDHDHEEENHDHAHDHHDHDHGTPEFKHGFEYLKSDSELKGE